MDLLLLPVFLIGAAALDTAWVALFRAQALGKFKLVREGSALFQFESDLGSFTILPREGRLTQVSGGRTLRVERDEIRGLEYRMHESTAWLQEVFFGLDMTDLLARYQDTVQGYSLTLVTHDGRRIALYASGQYQRREWLMTWYLDAQSALLERLGLVRDVEQQSRQVMELVRSRLGQPLLL